MAAATLVITSRPGTVKLVRDDAIQAFIPPVVSSADPGDLMSFNNNRAIVTAVGVQESANFQFMQTLGSDIYVYTFGDRIGQMTLGGLAFATADCSLKPGAGTEHGIAKVRRFYVNNKISSRKDPLEIALGNSDQVVTAFLTGFSFSIADIPTSLISWQMSLAVIPPKPPKRNNTGGSEPGSSNVNNTTPGGGGATNPDPAPAG